MKRMTFLALFAFAVGMVMAQTMYVHKTDGDVYEFKLSDVDSINFAASTIDDYHCTITYMPNGGEGEVVVDTVFYGESYIVGAFIQQEGYYVGSWNTDPDGNGVAFKSETVINSISRNITLYAQWRAYDGIENGYYYVDLGLPSGLKWAACNVGATKPEEYGNHYAWGETSTKSTYDWSTYKWCNGSYDTQTKYCTSSSYGTVDNKTMLDPADDAARANWGGQWRMPTDAEWWELRENCTWTMTRDYNGTGVIGRIVTSKTNGNHIFLPAAGYRFDDYLSRIDSNGEYWSSSLNTGSPDHAWDVNFNSDRVSGSGNAYRYYGQSVRPVHGESNSDNSSGSVSAPTGTENGHGYVDLGLPSGLKWATCNVGATMPEGYGDYYAWGETEPKTTYNWSTYKWCDGSNTTLTKYCTRESNGKDGFTDGKTVLDLEDDATAVNWGGEWRMPTDAEWKELIDNCTWKWTTLNGVNGYEVNGYEVKGTNGNSIFLPAAGLRNDGGLNSAGYCGLYWSSSLLSGSPGGAWLVRILSDGVDRVSDSFNRYEGLSVRPVLSPPNPLKGE